MAVTRSIRAHESAARISLLPIILLSGALLLFTACSQQKESSLPDDVLVTVGDSALTRNDVVRQIPRGLTPEDSSEMFQRLVASWLQQMLLTDVASENVDDMEHIEKMVSEYRNTLIIESYRRKLRASHVKTVNTDSLRAYYDRNSKDYILQRPVIKGLFIKVPSNASRLRDIRRWMNLATPDAIDNLEKYALGESVKYSFFEDKWMDAGTIEQQIPYRFYDPDAFVSTNSFFETEYAGMTYMLHISDHIPSGQQMPFEVALPLIRETLEARQSDAYEKALMHQLYENAAKEGKLKVYDKDNVKI